MYARIRHRAATRVPSPAMPQRPQPLPTAPSLDDTERLFARQFAMLLGPWYGAADGTRNAAEVEGIGESLAESSGTNESVGREAFVNLASALLPEWEALYKIPAPLTTTAARRTSLLARTRAGFIAHPRTIVEAIRGIAGTEATVLEPLWSEVTANPERVHVIVVRVSADAYGSPPDYTATYLQVVDVVDRMKPAHIEAVYTGAQTDGFLTDDPDSLTDNTVLRS